MSQGASEKPEGLRNGLALPLILNAAVIVLSALVLWWAAAVFREQLRTSTEVESRFVTAEWHLLREFKEQTDRQLAAKEREITLLRRKYRELAVSGATADELREIEEQLRTEESERDAILSIRFDPTIDLSSPDSQERLAPEPAEPVREETPPRSPASTVVQDAFARRIQAAMTQLQESRLRMQLLEDRNDSLRRQNERLAEELARTRREADSRMAAVSSAPTGAEEAVRALRAVVDGLEVRLAQGLPPAAASPPEREILDLVHTRALLRAIVGSPPISIEHPELAGELERYFEAVNLEQTVRGRREVYAAAGEALEAIAGELALEIETSAPAGTAEGYLSRLMSLLDQILQAGISER